MKPVIYCIEEYEYFNANGNNELSLDNINFLVLLSCREGTAQRQYQLSNIVKACEKHEPRLYSYLQNILANMEEFHSNDARLMQGLEQDGFDVSRLLYVFFDNANMEHIANWIKNHGKNQRRTTVEEIQKYVREEHDKIGMGVYLGIKMKAIRKVYEAMKEVALGYVPTLNLLETDQIRSLNTQLDHYALMVVDIVFSRWERLEEFKEEDNDDNDDFEEEKIDLFTFKGRRQYYLKFRKDYPVVSCQESPIFCVEIVEMVEEWESKGRNSVRVWYKLTCAEGEWYGDVDFEYLIQEAMLYFPDIYADAVKYYKASSSPRPRHPAMLHGLQRKRYDLTPVLASYVANCVNFLPDLREDMRLMSVFPDFQNSYEERRKWDREEENGERVEKFRIINFLRDGLVSEGIAVIVRELPEFFEQAPQSFLHYFEYWAFNDYIDPLNHLHEELKTAFELKRGLK